MRILKITAYFVKKTPPPVYNAEARLKFESVDQLELPISIVNRGKGVEC